MYGTSTALLYYLLESQHRHRQAAAADVLPAALRGAGAETRAVIRAGVGAWTGSGAATEGGWARVKAREGAGTVSAASSVSACIHTLFRGVQLARRSL